MSTIDFSWLFAAIALIVFILNVAAVAFLFTRWSRFPRPTAWALSAFGLFLLGQLGKQIILIVMGRVANGDSFVMYNALASFLGSMIHFAGLCMLITAVYVDRNPIHLDSTGSDPDNRPRPRDMDSNPYAV